MTSPALQVQDLEIVTPNGTRLVSGMTFEVSAGHLLGLLGETGAGKTLTARAVLGLLPRTLRASGKVSFDGRTWHALDHPEEVTHLLGTSTGLMLQNPAAAFDPMHRVGRQLIESVVHKRLMTRREATYRARELCEYLGLSDTDELFQLYPHELSGGMAQRLALALTLMPRPKLIVVDEPTSALDANLRVEALRLLRSIAEESGMAALLVSHDLGLVSRYCDSIAIVYAGRLVEYGSMTAVISAPTHPYTATLLNCGLTLDRPSRIRLPVIAGEPPSPGNWPSGCSFHPRCPDAQDHCGDERPLLTNDHDRGYACHHPRREGRTCEI
ncbi:ABC transporter ATP-binding protein [Amycolatopsis endophytica]|uniref:Oligopeptide/dipeptide ABC transporter ATP-binding protein n=1 Tax=Amycolatopsis endophytica TaxID=860233 RepID=A0A853AZE5_9PSEU|nr:ABC transporter ATP-binding protein [Amycolatopsis endophytica]NYI88100.1 oligopeptide/dipeptide ABC transporter ATP-binding protein [Amycolatopsis endophytica]